MKPGGSRWVAIGPDRLLLLHCSTPAGHFALLCYWSVLLRCLQNEDDISLGQQVCRLVPVNAMAFLAEYDSPASPSLVSQMTSGAPLRVEAAARPG